MLRFDIHQLPDGRTVATTDEHTATGQDPCRAIARDLVDAGAEDEPWEIIRYYVAGATSQKSKKTRRPPSQKEGW